MWACIPNCQSVNHHSNRHQQPVKVLLHCEFPTCREDGVHNHMHASPKAARPRTASRNTTQQVLMVSNACLRHQRQLNPSPGLPVVNCFCGVWRETASTAGAVSSRNASPLTRCAVASQENVSIEMCRARPVCTQKHAPHAARALSAHKSTLRTPHGARPAP